MKTDTQNGAANANTYTRGSSLSQAEVTAITDFIRTHRTEFPSKKACFTAALQASGAEGKIVNNSVAVQRYFEKVDGGRARAKSSRNKTRRVKPERQPRQAQVEQTVQINYCPNCGCPIRPVAEQLIMAKYLK